ncbi:MAG TPA: DUF4398 domain-containing protein [Pseudomonas sp.]|nr:DUF4398 domain-containing protein [Pseudomonas sp.]
MRQRIFALLALLLLAGCASSDPAPTAQLKLTEQAVEQARAVGAGSEQAELRLAEEELDAAHKAFQRQRFRKARMLAERAELDARLAEAQTLSGKSRAQLDELKANIVRLRKELRDLQ